MGWTSYHMGEGYTKKQACEAVLADYLTGSGMEAVASAVVPVTGHECAQYVGYVAFRYAKGTRAHKYYGDKVMCLVMLLGYHDGEGWYKDMDDTVYPCYFDCPESVLSKLSAPEGQSATEWRERCRENNRTKSRRAAARRRLAKVPSGGHVAFAAPTDGYPWPKGEPVDFMVVRGGKRSTYLRDPSGKVYQAKGMPYECLTF